MKNRFVLVFSALILLFSSSRSEFSSLSFLSQTLQPEFLVVKAHYSDPAMVNSLSSWTEPWEVHPNEQYLVIGVDQVGFNRLLDAGFRLEIEQQLTDQYNHPPQMLPQQTSGIPGFPCYRTLAETYSAAEALAASYPTLAVWIDIGDSWEKTNALGGSDLFILRLTNSAITGTKPKLFLLASIHAREYAPAELATRFAEKLLQDYETQAEIRWLLDFHEIHLMLQANPDGRRLAETRASWDYTWWRKNTNLATCPVFPNYRGADLNRNFDFQWGCCGGSSGDGCELTYRGASAASESETQAIQEYVRSQFPDQRGPLLSDPASLDASGIFLDIHSYGQLVLWPWGFTTQPPPNFPQLRTLGKKFAFYNLYEPAQSYELYITDGTTEDFAYGELGLAAYTFEVGTSFFESCDYFENVLLPQNLQALVYAAKVARLPYRLPGGPDVTKAASEMPYVLEDSMIELTAEVDDSRYFNGDDPPESIEPIQNIQAAEYRLDTPSWITTSLPVTASLNAIDGIYDEPIEQVSAFVDTNGLEQGRHIIFLRGMDETGAWGPDSAIFINVVKSLNYFPLMLK